MKIPRFFNNSKIDMLYLPDAQTAVDLGLRAGLDAAVNDKQKVLALLIDMQNAFVLSNGSLSVPGAVGDVGRFVDWMFANIEKITSIAASLDSHLAFQIFFPMWWADENGKNPGTYTLITREDVATGKWRAVIDPVWSIRYLEELEKAGKNQLMIWPYHTMIGSADNALVSMLFEAIMFHAAARKAQPYWLRKGMVPYTENYSVVEPDVNYPRHPKGGLNTQFLDMLANYDLIYIAGEAKSHCVLQTMRSIVNYFQGQDEVLGRIRFLMDCTSSVQHPDIDFEALANAELKEMAKLGIRLVTTVDKIA